MGFNRQKMELARKIEAEKQARDRRALDPQILEDAPLGRGLERAPRRANAELFAPTIGRALKILQ
jgi:hypothetical protein